VLREVDVLANARNPRILASFGGMGGTALPTAAVATVDCRQQSCRSNSVSSHGSNLSSIGSSTSGGASAAVGTAAPPVLPVGTTDIPTTLASLEMALTAAAAASAGAGAASRSAESAEADLGALGGSCCSAMGAKLFCHSPMRRARQGSGSAMGAKQSCHRSMICAW
jgi:hypothetical protein